MGWRIGKASVAHGVQIFKDYDGLAMGSEVICTMPQKGKGRTANARLIAAAPDLLEACKMALSCMAPEDNDITARKLREAIKKATEVR